MPFYAFYMLLYPNVHELDVRTLSKKEKSKLHYISFIIRSIAFRFLVDQT